MKRGAFVSGEVNVACVLCEYIFDDSQSRFLTLRETRGRTKNG